MARDTSPRARRRVSNPPTPVVVAVKRRRFVLEFNCGDATHGNLCDGAAFFRVLWRAARELFHEVTGTLFFLIALVRASVRWRAWHRGAGHWLVGMSAGYALLMIFFGVLSFRDSRRVR